MPMGTGYTPDQMAAMGRTAPEGQPGAVPVATDANELLALLKSGRMPAEALIQLLAMLAGMGAEGGQMAPQEEGSPIEQAFGGQ